MLCSPRLHRFVRIFFGILSHHIVCVNEIFIFFILVVNSTFWNKNESLESWKNYFSFLFIFRHCRLSFNVQTCCCHLNKFWTQRKCSPLIKWNRGGKVRLLWHKISTGDLWYNVGKCEKCRKWDTKRRKQSGEQSSECRQGRILVEISWYHIQIFINCSLFQHDNRSSELTTKRGRQWDVDDTNINKAKQQLSRGDGIGGMMENKSQK